MPADLPSDEFGKLAAVMLRLHADFRQRHGLPPPPSAGTLFERLEDLKRRSALNDPAVLHSPRPVIGRAIEGARRVLWKILKPIFDRQTEANLDMILALEVLTIEALIADRREKRPDDRALLARVAALEAELARRGERVT
jgi:hypothetical protein